LPSSYDDYDVTQLFQAVRDASEQLAPSRAQVLAWRRAVQALDKHRERLDSLRGQLAAKWPPETNAASAAYLRELDRLIDAVHQTSVAAASNQVHIEHVANAIDRAKREIEPLHDEYVENRTKLAQYENTLNEVGANATYVSGPLGGYLARKGAGIVLAPPVADGRQEELSRQARARMVPLTSTVTDAVSNMHAPPKYEPPIVERPIDPGSRIAGPAGGGSIRPPAIDPPAHARQKLTTTGAGDGANGNNGSVSGPGLRDVS
jgi:hypothetical protein